jgi:hypothetical protein
MRCRPAEPEPPLGVLGEARVPQAAPGATVHQVDQELPDADLDLVLEMHQIPHPVHDPHDFADAKGSGIGRRRGGAGVRRLGRTSFQRAHCLFPRVQWPGFWRARILRASCLGNGFQCTRYRCARFRCAGCKHPARRLQEIARDVPHALERAERLALRRALGLEIETGGRRRFRRRRSRPRDGLGIAPEGRRRRRPGPWLRDELRIPRSRRRFREQGLEELLLAHPPTHNRTQEILGLVDRQRLIRRQVGRELFLLDFALHRLGGVRRLRLGRRLFHLASQPLQRQTPSPVDPAVHILGVCHPADPERRHAPEGRPAV